MNREAIFRAAIESAADEFGVTPDDVTGRSMARDIADARMLLYAIMHEMGYSYSAIGRSLNRDHSTVLTGIPAIRDAMETSPALASAYESIKRRVEGHVESGGDGGKYKHVVCLSPDTVDFVSAP